MSSDPFVLLLTAAQRDVLGERQAQIMDARYGVDHLPTLEKIGDAFGVSRERIRQITRTCRRKLGARGRRDIADGETNTSCAQLVSAAKTAIGPGEEDEVERLIDFAADALGHLSTQVAYQLLGSLVYAREQLAASRIAEAKERSKKRAQDLRATLHEERRAGRLREICSFIIWPPSTRPMEATEILACPRAREVNPDGEGSTGEFYSGKLKRNVHFESQQELRFLLRLEEAEEIVAYQEQPFRIPYGREGRRSYYPDVLFLLRDGRGVVAEIKHPWQMPLAENLEKLRALRAYTRVHGLGMLVTSGQVAIQQVARHSIDPAYADAVLTQLREGPLGWKEYSEIRKRYELHPHDFPALVMRHKLVWKLSPFRLTDLRSDRSSTA